MLYIKRTPSDYCNCNCNCNVTFRTYLERLQNVKCGAHRHRLLEVCCTCSLVPVCLCLCFMQHLTGTIATIAMNMKAILLVATRRGLIEVMNTPSTGIAYTYTLPHDKTYRMITS